MSYQSSEEPNEEILYSLTFTHRFIDKSHFKLFVFINKKLISFYLF